MAANLDPSVYNNFYKSYIDRVIEDAPIPALEKEGNSMIRFIKAIPTDMANFAYAEGKWSVKRLFIHLLDCERVMAYRALCMARGDSSNLPGFDENVYAENSEPSNWTLDEISTYYESQRKSTIHMFDHLSEEALDLTGMANGIALSARSLAYIIAGHAMHHRAILEERYFPAFKSST